MLQSNVSMFAEGLVESSCVDPRETREAWLNEVAQGMASWFDLYGKPLPPFRVSVGFPRDGRGSRNAAGVCWAASASRDGTHEIFIHPAFDDAVTVASILCHELIHAAVGLKAKHGKEFRDCALTLGLTGPMTATFAGPLFKDRIQPILDAVGPFPHAALLERGESSGRPKQKTHMVKLSCPCCGYTVRTTRKWINQGLPSCPHGHPMDVD